MSDENSQHGSDDDLWSKWLWPTLHDEQGKVQSHILEYPF